MTLELEADDRMWLALPKEFPTAHDATVESWEDRVVDGMRDAWRGELDANSEGAVRAALQHGRDRITPEDSVTLQFWPTASVVNAIVHIIYGRFGDDEERPTVFLNGIDPVTEPVLEQIEAAHLGVGVEARYLRQLETETPFVVGGLTQLFANETHYVAVAVDATLPQIIGLVADPLRDVMNTVTVLDDDGEGRWSRSDLRVVPADSGSDGTWPLDPAERLPRS